MSADLSQHDLVAGLAKLGVEPTCHVMVHASLSKFGHVQGGAETVVAALRQAAGSEGAVIVPSFRDSIRSDYYGLRQCQISCPRALCTSTERGYTGKIGETVREEPDALRSCHPTHSWVGVGGDARFLLEGHQHSLTPCGTDSPFFRLMQRDGMVLLLGVGVNSITNIHAVEDARNVPYLSALDPPLRHATYTTSGRRIQYKETDALHAALKATGLLRSASIGAADCLAIGARDLGSFLSTATEDDPWCLVIRPGQHSYAPRDDAHAKTQRMAALWQEHPDRNAWQQLLAASRGQRQPVLFEPTDSPQVGCPAYCGVLRGYHRCAANDLPPWEGFDQFPADDPGVATCKQCNWRPDDR
jgi:aminoglycoside N3'-acetyltransferase